MKRKSSLYMVALPLILTLLLAACGGGGGGGGTTTTGGGPADAAKAFFDAAFAGNDITGMICSSNAAAAEGIAQGMQTMKDTLTASGAEIDTSGLTYTVKSESGDSAEVEVAGNIKLTVAGTSQEQEYPAATIPLRNENGWKVCG